MRRDAVEELYRLYASTVYKYLMCLCHDAHLAEDLTADAFEAALRGIHKFRGGGAGRVLPGQGKAEKEA